MRRALISIVLPVALAYVGCAAMFPDEVKQGAAETSYLAQHLRCVEENKNKPKAAEDACREAVRQRWCVDSLKNPTGCKDGAP